MKLWKIRRWLRQHFTPHYLIISHYTNTAIGCTCGQAGKADVLAEEPYVTFERVRFKACPICNNKEDN